MSVETIKAAIEELSEHDRRMLADWLNELEESEWDREIEEDFAPGGRGGSLLADLEREIALENSDS